jgi:acyl carrier protein
MENEILSYLQPMLKDKSVRLTRDMALIADGLIDSIQIMQLIGFLEETYSISLTDENDLHPGNFASVGALCTLVERKI